MNELNLPCVDYARKDYEYASHHERYKQFVDANGLICQECGGRGQFSYSDELEPPEPCGFCESTGLVTPHMRGLWLTLKRQGLILLLALLLPACAAPGPSYETEVVRDSLKATVVLYKVEWGSRERVTAITLPLEGVDSSLVEIKRLADTYLEQ